MREDLIFRFIEWQTVQLAPITPHWSEHVWSVLLKKDGLVINAAWPAPAPEDKAMTQAYAFLKASQASEQSEQSNVLLPAATAER